MTVGGVEKWIENLNKNNELKDILFWCKTLFR